MTGNPDRHLVPAEVRREIGARVRQVQDDLGLTQVQFAADLGLNTGSVSAIQRGKMAPSIGLLVHIARVCGVPPAFFLSGVEMPKTGEYQAGFRHGYIEAINRLSADVPPAPGRAESGAVSKSLTK